MGVKELAKPYATELLDLPNYWTTAAEVSLIAHGAEAEVASHEIAWRWHGTDYGRNDKSKAELITYCQNISMQIPVAHVSSGTRQNNFKKWLSIILYSDLSSLERIQEAVPDASEQKCYESVWIVIPESDLFWVADRINLPANGRLILLHDSQSKTYVSAIWAILALIFDKGMMCFDYSDLTAAFPPLSIGKYVRIGAASYPDLKKNVKRKLSTLEPWERNHWVLCMECGITVKYNDLVPIWDVVYEHVESMGAMVIPGIPQWYFQNSSIAVSAFCRI